MNLDYLRYMIIAEISKDY